MASKVIEKSRRYQIISQWSFMCSSGPSLPKWTQVILKRATGCQSMIRAENILPSLLPQGDFKRFLPVPDCAFLRYLVCYYTCGNQALTQRLSKYREPKRTLLQRWNHHGSQGPVIVKEMLDYKMASRLCWLILPSRSDLIMSPTE